MSDREPVPLSKSGRRPWEVAAQALREAGELVRERFLKENKVKLKGQGNLVTEADILSEQTILRTFRREFPGFRLISEESEAVLGDSPFTWIIDPLDGTNNFSFGIPFLCLSAALVRGEEILLGLIYDPLRRELFWAQKGGGAFLNHQPISAVGERELRRALVAFDLGYDEERGREMLEFSRRLWFKVHSLRILGSGALGLAYVAAGRIDLYLHRCLYPWDISAGRLIVEEAGGVVTDWEGKDLNLNSREIIAGRRSVHQEFISRLKEL